MWETWVRSLGQEGLLEKGTATRSSILAWRIPMDCTVHEDMTEPSSLLLSLSPFLLSALCIWASCLRASKAWMEPLDGPSVFSFPSYRDGQPWGHMDGGCDRQWSRTREQTLVASWVSTSLCSLMAATEPPSEFGPGWGRSLLLCSMWGLPWHAPQAATHFMLHHCGPWVRMAPSLVIIPAASADTVTPAPTDLVMFSCIIPSLPYLFRTWDPFQWVEGWCGVHTATVPGAICTSPLMK